MRELLAAVIILFVGATVDHAATLCEQKFELLAKSTGEPSMLAYSEQLTGECEQYRLHLLLLHPDVSCEMERSGFGNRPDFILDFFDKLGIERSVELTDSSGIYRFNGSTTVQAPEYDSLLDSMWVAEARAGKVNGEHDWCLRHRDLCFFGPRFAGAEATLLHRYHGGLYFNYTIDRVVYYPDSGVLVLITNQPKKKVGLDTMHGLLIYRLD